MLESLRRASPYGRMGCHVAGLIPKDMQDVFHRNLPLRAWRTESRYGCRIEQGWFPQLRAGFV